MNEPLKLNLGCGDKPFEGFKGVDLAPGADIHHDLRKPLPLEDNTVDEILVIHVIESFYQYMFPKILADWYRVMKPGAKITIEFTSLKDTVDFYLKGDIHGKWGLYGNQSYEQDPITFHHYVYETTELQKLMDDTGFRDVVLTQDNIMHMPVRDWRIIAIK